MAQVGAKPCPKCQLATVKNEGCNHMSCPCGGQWCWVCGKDIGAAAGVGWHYNPVNPLGCLQFQDHKMQSRSRRLRCLDALSRMFAFPGALVTTLLALLALSTGFLGAVLFALILGIPGEICAACCCKRCVKDYKCGKRFQCALLAGWLGITAPQCVPMFLFCIAWALIAVPLFLIIWPLGAHRDHFVMIASSPLSTLAALGECFGHHEATEVARGTPSTNVEEDLAIDRIETTAGRDEPLARAESTTIDFV